MCAATVEVTKFPKRHYRSQSAAEGRVLEGLENSYLCGTTLSFLCFKNAVVTVIFSWRKHSNGKVRNAVKVQTPLD